MTELRRQEFERRRKQLEDFNKKKPFQRRKQKPRREGEPGVIKKRRKSSQSAISAALVRVKLVINTMFETTDVLSKKGSGPMGQHYCL